MNRTRLTAAIVETLEDRKLLHAPAIDAIPNYTMPAGKHLYVPVTSSYDHSDPVAYTVIDDSSELQATVRTTRSSWIEMQVAGYSEPMVFQLFDDLAPKTVATMKGLVQAGYFDGQLFHRVINNFVLQGGDPKTLQPSSSDNVWGTGGPGFEFDDEFHPATVFSGDGQLAMANSGKDTNGSQFFITEGPQRGLDFNHAIWGQLVRGKATRNAISNTSVDSNSRPTSEIRITRMRVIANTKDTVLAIKANGIASGTVTVFANGAEGNDSQTFNVNSIADVTNDPPILSVPQSVYYTPVNTPIAIRLRGADLEGNPIDMRGAFIDSSGVEAGTIKDNVVRITPKAGFTGTITLYVGAGVVGAQSRGTSSFNESQPLGGIYDTQKITIAVGEKMISGTGTKFVYTSGAPANNIVVANFYDADRRGRASNFQAKINWGDGAITTGTIVQNADRSFSVVGSHAYGAGAQDGTYPVSVDITGNLGAQLTTTGAASVQSFASLRDGFLRVNGTSAADRIGVGRKGSEYHVTVNRATRVFSAAAVTRLDIYGYEDNDLIQISETGVIGAYIEGSDGNDAIFGGEGADVINAGAGRDTVGTGNGNNRVAGGSGHDTITGGEGRDRLSGGNNNDVIFGGHGRDIITGDGGNDTLVGNTSSDSIYGGAGDDVLNGLGSADYLDGGPGTNTARRDDTDIRIAIQILV